MDKYGTLRVFTVTRADAVPLRLQSPELDQVVKEELAKELGMKLLAAGAITFTSKPLEPELNGGGYEMTARVLSYQTEGEI